MEKTAEKHKKRQKRTSDARGLILIRMLHRKNGQVLFGDENDRSSWASTPKEVVEVVLEKLDQLTEQADILLNDIQIHVKPHNQKGEIKDDEKWSDQASNFNKYVEIYVNTDNS